VTPAAAAGLVAAMAGEGELVALRMARGCRCFAAVEGEEVSAYGWLSSGAEWIGEIRLEVKPEAGEVSVWNCLTLPSHRRRGMFRAVLVRISSALKEEGVGRLWIASGGGGAEKALPDAGFRPVLQLGESVSVARACAGSWPGARRIERVALAVAGTTVRGSPAPMALTSSEVSAPLRS